MLHLASNLVDLRLALFDSTAPSSQLCVTCSSHGTVLLLISWSAGCVASTHSSRCSDPGFPVVSFCSHQLVHATRLLQRVTPSLSWFLVQTAPAVGYAHFHSSYRSFCLQLAVLSDQYGMLFYVLSPPSLSVFLDARGVDDQAHHLLDRLRVTEDTHLWSIGTSFALTSLASCSLEAPAAIAVTASVAFTPCPEP